MLVPSLYFQTPGSCFSGAQYFELSDEEDVTSLLCTESIDSMDLDINFTDRYLEVVVLHGGNWHKVSWSYTLTPLLLQTFFLLIEILAPDSEGTLSQGHYFLKDLFAKWFYRGFSFPHIELGPKPLVNFYLLTNFLIFWRYSFEIWTICIVLYACFNFDFSSNTLKFALPPLQLHGRCHMTLYQQHIFICCRMKC